MGIYICLKVKKMGFSTKTICSTVSKELWNEAKQHKISISEAIRVGLAFILAEKGLKPYDNRLNLYRKMTKFQSLAQEMSQKMGEIDVLDKKINEK